MDLCSINETNVSCATCAIFVEKEKKEGTYWHQDNGSSEGSNSHREEDEFHLSRPRTNYSFLSSGLNPEGSSRLQAWSWSNRRKRWLSFERIWSNREESFVFWRGAVSENRDDYQTCILFGKLHSIRLFDCSSACVPNLAISILFSRSSEENFHPIVKQNATLRFAW